MNGESVCEESVPLYVGTRIMFGKSEYPPSLPIHLLTRLSPPDPMVWCVEIGEPTQKQLPSDTIQQVFCRTS